MTYLTLESFTRRNPLVEKDLTILPGNLIIARSLNVTSRYMDNVLTLNKR